MSNRRYTITDTEGGRWDVLPGDPAHHLCEQLRTAGYTPRLPPPVLSAGRIQIKDKQSHLDLLMRLVESARSLGRPEQTDRLVLTAWDAYAQLHYLTEHPHADPTPTDRATGA